MRKRFTYEKNITESRNFIPDIYSGPCNLFYQCPERNGKGKYGLHFHGGTFPPCGVYEVKWKINQLPARLYAGHGQSGGQGQYLCAA